MMPAGLSSLGRAGNRLLGWPCQAAGCRVGFRTRLRLRQLRWFRVHAAPWPVPAPVRVLLVGVCSPGWEIFLAVELQWM